MNEKDILDAIKKVKDSSKPRKFKQTYDLIVALKGLDIKKPDQQVDFFTSLHFPVKRRSICGLVGPELLEQARQVFDEAIESEEFQKYQADKKLAKRLADKHDYFVAQATIMPKVAQTFGRVFGPKGKMPNPKAGCVVPPNANLSVLAERLQLATNLKAKNHLMIQTKVGMEGQDDKQVAENIFAFYDQIVHHLPQEKNNIKAVYLKLTMGSPVIIGEKEEQGPAKKAKSAPKETSPEQETPEE